MSSSARSRVAVPLALGLVYVVWGSTYYAIRVGLVGGLPPMLLAAIRFLIAGGLLYTLLRLRGHPAPTPTGWFASLKVGVLLLTFGNGGVVIAEQKLASGLAATVVASVPIWAGLIAALGGHRPKARELCGMLIGVASVAMMQTDSGLNGGAVYAVVLLFATISWALGSMWSRRLPLPAGLMASAAEMLCGGAVLLVLATVRGERLHALPSAKALVALAYLIVFGSMVAYSAYAWLLKSVSPALATSYAYVNPIIALGLGAAYLGEPLTHTAMLSALGILVGVALVSWPARA